MSGEHENEPVESPRAAVTAEEDGRLLIRVRLPGQGEPPWLLLQRRPGKGKPEEPGRHLVLEREGPQEWRAVLETEPALEEGRWDAYVVDAPDGERVPLLPGLRDLRALTPDGGAHGVRAVATPLAVRIPYATKDGRLAVRAWHRATHAEAGRITLSGDTMTVAARLYGARLGEGAEASLHRRGRNPAEVRVPLRATDDQNFTFTVDYGTLVPNPGEPGATPVVWDVYVHPATGTPRIRTARLLDDLADRKQVFVYPHTRVGDWSAHPYYTLDNDLSVELTRSRPGE
ncbi:hypothetical protein [Streptomyces sp. NBC_00525]|uniref:hypothetical protein n=1 Tax=Streptomyces sp. NBC_00525 TaxID=2903660 RepID=UPI002E80B6F3|nr:hypothetical protein [Streptomyces sp. NBC_00525]WUC95145.1 hypothetical protein OG710_16815 [Streptomyces sp. NBC_00525]